MRTLLKKWFLFLLLLYTLLFIIFIGQIMYLATKQIPVIQSSPIPVLSKGALDKIYTGVGKREQLPPFEEIDLAKFSFGNSEPFNQ